MKVASGCVSRAYLEIEEADQGRKYISRLVLRLGASDWYELLGVTTKGGGFQLPEPLGCNCTITDIGDRNWEGAAYEIEFASSYSRDGVFWARGIYSLAGFNVGVPSGAAA